LALAAWPIARPSEKLCRPIPAAIVMPRRSAWRSGVRPISATAIPSTRVAAVNR
jgi:hypothetical protein